MISGPLVFEPAKTQTHHPRCAGVGASSSLTEAHSAPAVGGQAGAGGREAWRPGGSAEEPQCPLLAAWPPGTKGAAATPTRGEGPPCCPQLSDQGAPGPQSPRGTEAWRGSWSQQDPGPAGSGRGGCLQADQG